MYTNVDICNMAMRHLGGTGGIASISSPTSQNEILCAGFYEAALDTFLTDTRAVAARRYVALSLVSSTDDDAPPFDQEWAFAYAFPVDPDVMLQLLKVVPSGAPKMRPSEEFDTFAWMPSPATPSATSTGSDYVTFTTATHWPTGTRVTPSATVGGLTAGTQYYVQALSTTTFSFHTTYALAVANGTKVDLTATITAEIRPTGAVNMILTNLEDAYAEFIARVDSHRTGDFTGQMALALSYLLASLLAGPVIKGEKGAAEATRQLGKYALAKSAVIRTDRGKDIKDSYANYQPKLLKDR